jgi:DNA-binding response OmpR family regulator
MHILLVEDDRDLARELAEFFRRRKHTVTTCHSLAEAQAVLKDVDGAGSPEAILCDGNLPDGNGVDFYCRASSTFAGRWILMSGAHDDHRLAALGDAVACEQLAIVDKPVSLRELARILKIA